MIAKGEPLQATAVQLCAAIEWVLPGVICSIMTVDRAGLLHPLASPGLPEEFLKLRTLHAVLAVHLLDEQLAVAQHGHVLHPLRGGDFQAADEGRVLGDVVRGRADGFGFLDDGPPALR